MSEVLKKVRKLFRDPLLFAADSRALRDRFDGLVKRRRGTERVMSSEHIFGNVDLKEGIDFVVYFPSGVQFAYQVEQWLPALNALAETHSVLILTRTKSAHRHFLQKSKLLACYCSTLDSLMSFYENVDIRCVLYVNNAAKNFQSLINHRSMHVHINHGESEKSCMHSNQAKAYDYVFVVAKAGLQRYQKHLLKMDPNAFIEIGRPQLDGIQPMEHKIPGGRKVILYAPTWSAAHASMNYSSIADFGEQIARTFLGNPKYYFIYRPHPSVGTIDRQEKESDATIRELIEQSNNAVVIMDIDINRIFPRIDLAIMDNSSVVVDYLRVDKPFLMTDMLIDRSKGPVPIITKAGRLIAGRDYDRLESIVDAELQEDSKQAARHAARAFYLGDYQDGESTKNFIRELERILAERRSRLEQRAGVEGEHVESPRIEDSQ